MNVYEVSCLCVKALYCIRESSKVLDYFTATAAHRGNSNTKTCCECKIILNSIHFVQTSCFYLKNCVTINDKWVQWESFAHKKYTIDSPHQLFIVVRIASTKKEQVEQIILHKGLAAVERPLHVFVWIETITFEFSFYFLFIYKL